MVDNRRYSTAKLGFVPSKTQHCSGCNRSRSLPQFDGKEKCRVCRGVTTPVVVTKKVKPQTRA